MLMDMKIVTWLQKWLLTKPDMHSQDGSLDYIQNENAS